MNEFKFLLLSSNATFPTKGTKDAAGWDLCSAHYASIRPRDRAFILTGLKARIPKGTYGRIAPRSGLSLKGIDVAAGVIDRDYAGELKVVLVNNSTTDLLVNVNDQIAQLIVERIATVNIEIVNMIGETSQGTQGFGSSGK